MSRRHTSEAAQNGFPPPPAGQAPSRHRSRRARAGSSPNPAANGAPYTPNPPRYSASQAQYGADGPQSPQSEQSSAQSTLPEEPEQEQEQERSRDPADIDENTRQNSNPNPYARRPGAARVESFVEPSPEMQNGPGGPHVQTQRMRPPNAFAPTPPVPNAFSMHGPGEGQLFPQQPQNPNAGAMVPFQRPLPHGQIPGGPGPFPQGGQGQNQAGQGHRQGGQGQQQGGQGQQQGGQGQQQGGQGQQQGGQGQNYNMSQGIDSFATTNPQFQQGPPRRGYKRLILACDGTWLIQDGDTDGQQVQLPSNVTHLTRAIKSESRNGIPQVVFYQSGAGTEGGPIYRLVAGTTGSDLADHILEAYYFLAQNYMPGDEIFLLGFSRGAFTARSVAGFIDGVGLLTKEGIKSMTIIFKDYENRLNGRYESAYPDIPFPNKPDAASPDYKAELARRGLSRLNVPIKAIGVFDTVGSLGIPRVPLLERLGLQRRSVKEYTFYDTSLSDGIEFAFQALALDEQRAAFAPAVWEKRAGNGTDLRQVWFPGVHTNVGGGYADSNLSNISLAWMMAQLQPLLEMDAAYALAQHANALAYYAAADQRPRPWSLGLIVNSMKGLYVLGGKRSRTPGSYVRQTPDGRPTDRPLRQTNEYVHASCRARFMLDGLGTADAGLYEPKALLDEYRLRLTQTAGGGAQGAPSAVWESRRKSRSGGGGGGASRKILAEAPLWDIERRLLGLGPEAERVEAVVLRPTQVDASAPVTSWTPNGGAAGGRPHRRTRDVSENPAPG